MHCQTVLACPRELWKWEQIPICSYDHPWYLPVPWFTVGHDMGGSALASSFASCWVYAPLAARHSCIAAPNPLIKIDAPAAWVSLPRCQATSPVKGEPPGIPCQGYTSRRWLACPTLLLTLSPTRKKHGGCAMWARQERALVVGIVL